MKTIFFSMAAVSAIAAAQPAMAQYNNGTYQNQAGVYQNQNGGNFTARIDQLRARIQAGTQSGVITRQEAVSLRQQLRALTRIDRQYGANGYSGQEMADLQQRIRNLRQQVRVADGGGRGRYDQYDRQEDMYGANGQYGQYGQYGQNGQYDQYGNSGMIDQNRDGIDDRDYNRNGRWDDDANNGTYNNGGYNNGTYNNGAYNNGVYQQPVPRSGLGGLIDTLLGTGGLRVGQQVSGNLGAVPYQYQNQFRDGNGVYYRSDRRQIYQIDARTNTVVQIYAMPR